MKIVAGIWSLGAGGVANGPSCSCCDPCSLPVAFLILSASLINTYVHTWVSIGNIQDEDWFVKSSVVYFILWQEG